MVQHGCRVGQVLTKLVGRTQAGARREQVAQIIGQPFINPKQIAMHWLLVVGRNQTRRTLVLAIPRVNKLMRKKIRFKIVHVTVTEHLFIRPVVAGFVMLQAVVRRLVAQRKQKSIFGVMARAKKFAGFRHQLLETGDVFISDLNCFVAFTHHVNHMRERLARRRDLHLPVN